MCFTQRPAEVFSEMTILKRCLLCRIGLLLIGAKLAQQFV
jgi:hypothetical protein